MDLRTLVENEVIKKTGCAEVVQVILLISDTNICWNYFTHIDFSDCHKEVQERKYLTKSPITINYNVKVIISKEVISIADLIPVLEKATEKQIWEWGEDRSKLDETFPIDPCFVPETDPTGSKTSDSTLVPIELALYGSNFLGNYYICELFSTKKNINELISERDKKRIQDEIKNAGLQYNLVELSDRIGNVVCKVHTNVVKHKIIKLTPERGISGMFTRAEKCRDSIKCALQIIVENDNSIIDSQIKIIELSDEQLEFTYEIASNRYRNTIILSNLESGVIYYSAIRDYSYGSSYYATINPPKYVIQSSLKRTIYLNGKSEEISLTNIAGIGNVYIEKEIFEIEKRQNKWMTQYEYDHYFFRSFMAGQENEAVQALISICNDKELFWDLQEIWLVDPYLSADDILKTVVHCSKYGIIIKCLTHIATISGNVNTRSNAGENGGLNRSGVTVIKYRDILENAIPKNSDLKLEYRTVRGDEGISFHDRYIILKYGMNKSRAWSLGISVNSLGKSHHIIQIVQSPMDVIATIDTIWNSSNGEDCLIYKN